MLEFTLATEPSLDNLAQALGLDELAEQHDDELIPTRRVFGALFGAKGLGSGVNCLGMCWVIGRGLMPTGRLPRAGDGTMREKSRWCERIG